MSDTKLCDICKKPIVEHKSVLFSHGLYSQYIVKIKRLEEGWSLAGYFRKTQVLDVCPKCMDKFVEFARMEKEND
jgi:hypothetical protein